MGWYSVPALHPPQERISIEEFRKNTVDACQLLEPLLDQSALAGSLRVMDVANGCGVGRDTCYADAPLPTKMFSYESLDRLFHDKRFLDFVQDKPAIFETSPPANADALAEVHSKYKNIGVIDVLQKSGIDKLTHGRILAGAEGRSTDNTLSFEDRGFVKTFLNPDQLWLMVYTTVYESRTCRAFTPITPENLQCFRKLPCILIFLALRIGKEVFLLPVQWNLI